jgi:hypothetical protein
MRNFTRYIRVFQRLIHRLFLTLKRRLIRRLSLRRETGDMPTLAILPVENGRVACHAVLRGSVYGEPAYQIRRITHIPNNDGTSPPADTRLDILRQGNVIIQEL